MTKPAQSFLALGSNMGDKVGTIGQAIALLESHSEIDVVSRSKLYKTPPWGEEDQDWFVNACLEVTTTFTPLKLLDACQAIENELGRVRAARWGPRVIDLDVLTYGDLEYSDRRLTLPHPRITERAFVLVPLHDLAPNLLFDGKPVSAWLDDVDRSGITVVDPADEPSPS